MKELFAGIWSLFNATNTFKTAIGGRMYPGEAPQEPAFPYAVYSLVSDIPDFDFTDDHADIQVQFAIYSEQTSPSESFDLFALLKTLFDDARPTVTGWTVLSFQRSRAQLDRDTEMKTWGYIVEYDILLERRRS